MALSRHYSEYHGTINKPPLHEAYIVTFIEQPSCHSLGICNICKATTVTHTKRIYRNLLRKETSFVYYTSSVLIQIESLGICENEWYHLIDAQIIQNMILPHVK